MTLMSYIVKPLEVCAYIVCGSIACYGQGAPACGNVLGPPPAIYKGIPAFSNGANQWNITDCDPHNTHDPFGDFGEQYQCVEYVKRFYYQALGITKARQWTGNAADYFPSANADVYKNGSKIADNKQLTPFANGSVTRPAPDDILVFGGHGLGHVAIITNVTDTAVTIIEQNWDITGTHILPSVVSSSGYFISDRISRPPNNQPVAWTIQGWLRGSSCPATFTDDFNRPDGSVGNGWSNTTGNINGDLVIRNGALSTPVAPSGAAGVFRPINLSAPVTVSATVTQGNGNSGLLKRYDVSVLFGSNGALSNGYGVTIHRGDQNFTDSLVGLVLNGSLLATTPASFQFGASITLTVTFSPDGSISGSVAGDGGSSNFNFGQRNVVFAGPNIEIYQGFPDGVTTNTVTRPTVDDIIIRYVCPGL